MLNEREGRNYNDNVLTLLRYWINVQAIPVESPLRFVERIACCATSLLRNRGFLSNVKELEAVISEEEIRYRPRKELEDKPVAIAKFPADRFYGAVGRFIPSVSKRACCCMGLQNAMVQGKKAPSFS